MSTTASSRKTRTARFPLLDLLRITAALMVVAFHFTGRQSPAWSGRDVHEVFPGLSNVTQYGFLGVELFFLISGFVIFMSSDGRTVGQFAASRISRLYPAYWVAVLLTAGLHLWLAPNLGKDLSLQQVLANLTMFQSAFRVDHLDGVYWTLWVEMVFYLLIATLIICKVNDRGMTIFAFVWPLLGLAITLTRNTAVIADFGLKYSAYFAFGMLLYLIHKNGHRVVYWVGLALDMAIGIRQTVTFDAVEQADNVGRDLSATVVIVALIAIFVTITFIVLGPIKHWGGAWMFWVGALTYPLYLIHEHWGWWFITVVDPVLGSAGAALAATAFSLVAAYLIHRFVEKPFAPKVKDAVLRATSAQQRTDRPKQEIIIPPEYVVPPAYARPELQEMLR